MRELPEDQALRRDPASRRLRHLPRCEVSVFNGSTDRLSDLQLLRLQSGCQAIATYKRSRITMLIRLVDGAEMRLFGRNDVLSRTAAHLKRQPHTAGQNDTTRYSRLAFINKRVVLIYYL